MDDALAGAIASATMASLALAICIVMETISPRVRYGVAERIMGAVFIVVLPASSALMTAPLAYVWQFCFGIAPLLDVSFLPAPLIVLVVVLCRDFLNYWQHRLDHWALWPIHAVHHSQTELHAANGYGHPLQLFAEFLIISVPLSFVNTGDALIPVWVMLLLSVQAMVIHSPLRVHLGPLRRVFNDSRFHRIHHSVEERHFGKNYGTIFTIWDQVFGTAYFPQIDEWPDVGVEGLAPPRTPLGVVVYPLRVAMANGSGKAHA